MTAPGGARRLTVQGWLNVVLSAVGVVVLAGAIAGSVLLQRTDEVSRELVGNVQPARVAAYQLQAALRDQETALRGYAIAADRQFLEPYFEGQRAERSAADDIRSHLGYQREAVDDLDAIEKAAADWRTAYADPLIAGTAGGQDQFDRLRALFKVQNEHLSAVRQAGVDELASVRAWRNGVLGGLIVTFFAMTVLLAVLTRSAVTRPLESLAAACRRITEGNFGERIVPRGPRDIRGIAVDVEDMRQRIVEELEAARSAQTALDEQAVELRRSNAELEQFAYVASHDLQEPLRKVASFCQLLEKRYGDKLDERGTEYIAFAVDGAKRMQVLINDLLTFSRVGRLNATTTEVKLDATLDVALGNLSTAVEESGAQIVRPSAGLPRIDGDPTLLVMVWQNLISNAVKFRREGVAPQIVIECDQRVRDDDADWIFTVSDNGIGIPQEFADKVFVIFQRLHGRDAYSGTGIGLALCKKIVEHHGGNIWIDTSHTGGTRFQFTLPVQPTAEPEPNPAAMLEGAAE
ncbi:bacteriophytochrome (light-regulated signal transduction histidine kinase) [Mycobacterium sp. JS623]|uniref:sensor histidine kinase n=1 Tax=Mycobacterium sp. JS623 TaxID=212767 RepID=UPI0002A5842B|nr:sensor histidine kinase [Mycobacterium sp. JS623]AGB26531.1 bacteriophytochrome (light-regulated signal transduction histidine kinase) [Mycobacterium sp. JS623]